MTYAKILDKLLWCFVTLLLFSFYATQGSASGKNIQLIITAIIAILCVIRYKKNLGFKIELFHVLMGLFTAFCFISYLWTIYPESCIHRSLLIAQTFLCLSVVYIYADHQNSSLYLLDSIRWTGYLLTIYLFYIYGWKELHYMLQDSVRLDSNILNSNVVGMLCAFSIVLTIYRFLFVRFSIWYLLALPTFMLLAISGSRKAFFILLLGSAAVLSTKYLKKNIISNLVTIFLFMLFICILFYFILSIPAFEYIKVRLEGMFGFLSSDIYIMDSSSYHRKVMIEIGFNQFLETPLLGLGIGGSGILTQRLLGTETYLHNNYIEMLACGGIVGTFLYYLLYIVPGIQLLKQIFSSEKNTLVCLVLMIILLFVEWGLVTYESKEIYFFILIFFIQVKINNRNFIGIKNENI